MDIARISLTWPPFFYDKILYLLTHSMVFGILSGLETPCLPPNSPLQTLRGHIRSCIWCWHSGNDLFLGFAHQGASLPLVLGAIP